MRILICVVLIVLFGLHNGQISQKKPHIYLLATESAKDLQKDWNMKPFVELRRIPPGKSCSDISPEFESIFNVQWNGTIPGCVYSEFTNDLNTKDGTSKL